MKWGPAGRQIEMAFCRGHRPSQLDYNLRCDGEYTCVDRSDETGCNEASLPSFEKIQTYVEIKVLHRQPMINKNKIFRHVDDDERKICDSPKPLSSSSSACPIEHSKTTCNNEQVLIGEKCYHFKTLCRKMNPFKTPDDLVNPDHVTFCQNYTFWRTKVKNDTTEKPWPRDEDGNHACRGNFPGFSIGYFPTRDYRSPHHLEPGCRDIAWCPDQSDIVCPANDTRCDHQDFFRCSDNVTCVPSSLVCDGYRQCSDGSDEDQEYCRKCPLKNGDGHPFRTESNKFSNTFSCTHRYTGTLICAVRCDGLDDLCLDYGDEVGCEDLAEWWVYLLGAVAAVSMLGIFFRVAELLHLYCKIKGKSTGSASVVKDSVPLGNLGGSKVPYGKHRLERGYGSQVIASIHQKELGAVGDGAIQDLQEYCRRTYKKELDYNAGDESATNAFFYKQLGTCHAASVFFDNIDNGWFFRKKKYCRKITCIQQILENLVVLFTVKTVFYMSIVLTYYLDIFKDILLSHRLYTFLPDELPAILFSLTVTSIVLGELANIVAVLHFKAWSRSQRLFASLFIYMVPAMISYRMYRIERKIDHLAGRIMEKRELLKLFSSLENLTALRSQLRANENTLEHLPQLITLLLLILIKKTKTSTVSLYLSQNLVPENELIFFASALVSFLSLVRGQLFVLNAKKNGFLPLVGKLILLGYYVTGIFGRIFAFLLYFTPNFGLLNTLFHDKHSILDFSLYGTDSEAFPAIDESFDPKDIFDFQNNGTPIFAYYKWKEHYQQKEVLDQFPKQLLFLPLLLIIIIHFPLSKLFQKIYFKSIPHPQVPFSMAIIDDLGTFLCTPLHLDWEVLYRRGRSTGISVKECWVRSKKLLHAYNLLLFLEHLILMIPLMILKISIDERNGLLMKDFPPNADEQISTETTSNLLTCGIFGFAALPFVSFGFAYLYFMHGHAYSRILRANI